LSTYTQRTKPNEKKKNGEKERKIINEKRNKNGTNNSPTLKPLFVPNKKKKQDTSMDTVSYKKSLKMPNSIESNSNEHTTICLNYQLDLEMTNSQNIVIIYASLIFLHKYMIGTLKIGQYSKREKKILFILFKLTFNHHNHGLSFKVHHHLYFSGRPPQLRRAGEPQLSDRRKPSCNPSSRPSSAMSSGGIHRAQQARDHHSSFLSPFFQRPQARAHHARPTPATRIHALSVAPQPRPLARRHLLTALTTPRHQLSSASSRRIHAEKKSHHFRRASQFATFIPASRSFRA
ncbi:Unknown protein, partial [Striga hermonthica]